MDPTWEFCMSCGYDAQNNMMMPLFVASATRRRLFRLGLIWVLALILTVYYTLGHSLAVGLVAFVIDAVAIGVSFFLLRQRAPYSYQFFEDFVRVTYPSSFTHLNTIRVHYSTFDDFVVLENNGKGGEYEFSSKGEEGIGERRFVVRNVTNFGGGGTTTAAGRTKREAGEDDFSQWIEGRIPIPVRRQPRRRGGSNP
jgi:hypothetical protein